MPKKFSIVSLGCLRNAYDSELVAKRFLNQRFTFLPQGPFTEACDNFKNCDTLVINTCGFIDKAKEESIEAIRAAVKLKKNGKIKHLAVFGCLVQRYKSKLKDFFPQVDAWWGIEPFGPDFGERKKITPHYIDFIKISEGCLNCCSYCAIPLIKGTLKSKPEALVLREAELLDRRGVKELNIIGQDITSWGMDLGGADLASLLGAVLKVIKHIRWVRLLYTHPCHINGKLLDIIANEPRICKYIDMPIQHASDRILKLMNRNITKKQIVNLIRTIRKKIPQCVIRTSLIVGFPGETDKEFCELLRFLEEERLERVGAFTYSREENTPAYHFAPQIHHRIKVKRLNDLLSLQSQIAKKANRRFVGKSLEVLVEEKTVNVYIARSEYDAHEIDGVVFLKKNDVKVGDFCRAKIIDSYEYDLVGV